MTYPIICGIPMSDLDKELVNLYSMVQEWARDKDFKYIDWLLDLYSWDIILEETEAVILVGLLRYTFAYRSKLFKWMDFLHSVDSELKRRNLNTEELLQGLK